jgi:hypothetical protein
VVLKIIKIYNLARLFGKMVLKWLKWSINWTNHFDFILGISGIPGTTGIPGIPGIPEFQVTKNYYLFPHIRDIMDISRRNYIYCCTCSWCTGSARIDGEVVAFGCGNYI